MKYICQIFQKGVNHSALVILRHRILPQKTLTRQTLFSIQQTRYDKDQINQFLYQWRSHLETNQETLTLFWTWKNFRQVLLKSEDKKVSKTFNNENSMNWWIKTNWAIYWWGIKNLLRNVKRIGCFILREITREKIDERIKVRSFNKFFTMLRT